jgi:hypothetical protein
MLTLSAAISARADDAATLRMKYESFRKEYLAQLHAAGIEGWAPLRPVDGILLFVAEDDYTPISSTETKRQPTPLHREHAERLFELAKHAADAGQLSLAFQWATEAVREDPDHAEARRVLGYKRVEDQWHTMFGARMHQEGKRWHGKYGWIEPANVPRYERGERLLGSKWISADIDARRHERIEDGWQIRTDHFLVTTNHSLEAAAALAVRLEELHQVWRQLFAGFYLGEREVQRLFASPTGRQHARSRLRPFRVMFHRNRNQYIAALSQRQPRIAETLGIYFDMQREAHFFADTAPGDQRLWTADHGPLSTLYHEAVHQLFQESQPPARHVGRMANFWIVEGAALYFESLTGHENELGRWFTIGESAAGRLPAARQRLLADGSYIPLVELTSIGQLELQGHPNLSGLYSQAAGLATFLMQADSGRFREPLVRYLSTVYAGRDNPATLEQLTGAPYDELDAQYRRFLESLPK